MILIGLSPFVVWNIMYQHNPYGGTGPKNHYGHATSKDLIYWTENLFHIAHDLGSNHSGGAVVDFIFSAGLQTSDYKISRITIAGHSSQHLQVDFSNAFPIRLMMVKLGKNCFRQPNNNYGWS